MENHRSPLVPILTVLAVVMFVGGVVTGIAIGFETDSFAIALGIWVGAFITGILFLYASEILKHLEYISSKISQLPTAKAGQVEEQYPTQNSTSSEIITPAQSGASQTAVADLRPTQNDTSKTRMGQNLHGAPVAPVLCESNWEVCPACGTKQVANRKRCYNCEVEFVRPKGSTENA